MNSLGILVLNTDQEKQYLTEIAKASADYQMTIYLLLPNQIDPFNKTFKGKKYCHQSQSWIDGNFPIPFFIYDRCFYNNKLIFKQHESFVSWLKSQPEIYFLGHGLANKWVVYNILRLDQLINYFLPETNLLTSIKQIEKSLTQQHSVLLKPISGSQGKGIFIVSKHQNQLLLIGKKNQISFHERITPKQLEQFVKKITKNRKYIIQPYLSLTTNDQRPFDLRVFLQKNKNGLWKEMGRGIRLGRHGDYTSNISSGGEIVSYPDWLKSICEKKRIELEQNLKELLFRVPEVLENNGEQLFEVGLDFGYDNNGKLWLLEVNSKPGRKVVTATSPNQKENLAKAPILYCLFLQNKIKKGVGLKCAKKLYF